MRNRRGQFFAFYLVFITLFMCGVVIGVYVAQQKDLRASLVSPMEVLKDRDALSVFEMRERILIESCAESAGSNYKIGTDDFLNSFYICFVSGVVADSEMTNFLLENLFVGGKEFVVMDKNNFIEEGVYVKSNIEFVDGKLVFYRSDLEKRRLLVAKDRGKIDFPVDFNFKFGKKYLISEVGGKYKVEAVL